MTELGIQYVSDSRSSQFVADIRRWTAGEGVDVVLNCLGGTLLTQSFDLLREHGRFVEIGVKDYYNNAALGLRPFLRNLSLTLVNLRTMVVAQPERGRKLLLEVLQQFAAGVFSPVPHTCVPVSRAAEAFRQMAQAKHRGKLILTMQDPSATMRREDAAPPAPTGTWVITGGLRGVGLATAQWLVDAGVRSIALLGRSGPSPQVEPQLASLAAAGVTLHIASVDVADRDALATALATIRRDCGPIHGVVHAAVVLDDAGILAQTFDRFATVFAGKAIGAWNLHALTQADPLTHFIVYSSGAALLGSPGQANYCAANAWVDALAYHRRAAGQPALTIHWGLFAEVGQAADRADRGQRIAAQGMDSLDPATAGQVFRQLLGESTTQVAVMALDVRRWRQSYPRAAQGPLLSALAATPTGAERAVSPLQQQLLQAGDAAAVHPLLVGHIIATLAQVLRLDGSRIAATTRMGTLGLDSLMAIELRNRLEASTGLTLSVTMMWNYPTPAQLADYLGEKLTASLGIATKSPEPEPAPPAEPSQFEQTLEAADDDALADMLDAQLAALEDLV